MKTKKSPLVKAIEILGGQKELARACGISQPSVHKWLQRPLGVPAERVLEIERATNGAVTRYELRPDIYPRED